MSLRAVAEKYGISIGTVSNWKNKKENLVESVLRNELSFRDLLEIFLY